MVDRDLLLRKLADLDQYLGQVSEYRDIHALDPKTKERLGKALLRATKVAGADGGTVASTIYARKAWQRRRPLQGGGSAERSGCASGPTASPPLALARPDGHRQVLLRSEET